MYEDFRKDILLELSKILGDDSKKLMETLGAIDKISAKYTIETKIQELVPIGKINEESLHLYLANLNLEGKSKGTIKNKFYALTKFLQAVGAPLDKITTNDIRSYLYMVKETTSETNEEKTRQYLTSFFDFCVTEEILTKNPCNKIRRIKTEKAQIHPLSDDDLQTLFNGCESLYETALISFLYSTGARISEAASVKISDLDLKNGEVHLFGKGKKHRTAYLSNDAIKDINAYLSDREDKDDILFPNTRGKEKHQISPKALRDAVKKIANRGGIKVNPHQIRHTTATNLQKEMPIQMVSEYLGHENISTTMIYTEINRSDLKAKYKEIMNKEAMG